MAEQNDLPDLSLKSMNHLFGGSDPFWYLGGTSTNSSSEKPIALDMSIKTTLALH
jgi:hypothetical protein